MSENALPHPEDILRKAYSIGNYYGFAPFASLAEAAKGNKPPKRPYPEKLNLKELDPMAQTVAAFLKQVRDAGLTPSTMEPLFVWHTNITPGRKAPKQAIVQFHALGVPHAIADIVLMRAAQAFTEDILKTNLTLHLNSVGDKETRARFARELSNYFRKHGDALPPDCVECAKRDVFEATESLISKSIRDDLPSSIDHLSEASRKHFEGVLDFLEETNIPYTLTPKLISRAGVWSETCFELRKDDKRMVWGSRYNNITSHFFDQPIPSATAIVRLTTNRNTVSGVRKPTKPKVMFLHIGDKAKLISMNLAEEIRNSRLPISQMIGIRSLNEQMRLAEAINPQYFLIIGHKEALEGVAVLRDRNTYSETAIPINTLIKSLRAAI